MRSFHSQLDPIGEVFTPLRWAKWLVERAGLVRRWAAGATVCDPTAGKGVFAHALLDVAAAENIEVDEAMLSRVFLIERQPNFLSTFESEFASRHRRSFPKSNLICADIILSNPKRKFDFLLGNPPWANFGDLAPMYKEATKPFFIEYGLVHSTQALLLGGSRVDLAALVLAVVLNDNLEAGGEASFFLPLSLFFNDGAQAGFRRFQLKDSEFRVVQIWDFRGEKVFHDILTRVGAALFRRNEANTFPVDYRALVRRAWTVQYAAPIGEATAPLSVFTTSADLDEIRAAEPITVRAAQKPRQGVNTCGANSVYIFDSPPKELPQDFVFPLLTKECFRAKHATPQKFILLPYNPMTGNPLTEAELRRHSGLWCYLSKHKEILAKRKGTMLGAWLKRGVWWACLGVGDYCFTSHKVAWEAYGKSSFAPQVFSSFEGKPWQANQAMHSFIPCVTQDEAQSLLNKLHSSQIEAYLKSLNIEGTCNWAQPGRIKRFLKFEDEETSDSRQLALV